MSYAFPQGSSSPSSSVLNTLTSNSPLDITSIKVPYDYASIESFHKGHNGKTLIHIQDAHSNYSGQKNIASTLKELIDEYSIDTVLVEGGYGDVSLNELKSIASKKDWDIVANKFLMKSLITGPEYLNLTTNLKLKLLGLEDKDLYESNVLAYSKIKDKRQSIKDFLHSIQVSLDRLKYKLYPKRLIDYEKTKDPKDFTTHFNTLLELIESTPLEDLNLYPNIKKLKELTQKEDTLDFTSINKDQKSLWNELNKLYPKDKQTELTHFFKSTPKSHYATRLLLEELITKAKEVGIPIARYPYLLSYLLYLEEFNTLKMDTLMQELESLEDHMYGYVIDQVDTKKLRAIDRYLNLVRKAYDIKLTTNDYKMLKYNEPIFKTKDWMRFINQKLTQIDYKDNLLTYKPLLENSHSHIIDFYTLVEDRDKTFLHNTNTYLKDQNKNKAFIITGGYHTEHLTHLLKKEGYSLLTLTPNIEHHTDQSLYEKILLSTIDKYKTPSSNNKPIQLAKAKHQDYVAQLAARLALEDRAHEMASLADGRLNTEDLQGVVGAKFKESQLGSRLSSSNEDKVLNPKSIVLRSDLFVEALQEQGLNIPHQNIIANLRTFPTSASSIIKKFGDLMAFGYLFDVLFNANLFHPNAFTHSSTVLIFKYFPLLVFFALILVDSSFFQGLGIYLLAKIPAHFAIRAITRRVFTDWIKPEQVDDIIYDTVASQLEQMEEKATDDKYKDDKSLKDKIAKFRRVKQQLRHGQKAPALEFSSTGQIRLYMKEPRIQYYLKPYLHPTTSYILKRESWTKLNVRDKLEDILSNLFKKKQLELAPIAGSRLSNKEVWIKNTTNTAQLIQLLSVIESEDSSVSISLNNRQVPISELYITVDDREPISSQNARPLSLYLGSNDDVDELRKRDFSQEITTIYHKHQRGDHVFKYYRRDGMRSYRLTALRLRNLLMSRHGKNRPSIMLVPIAIINPTTNTASYGYRGLTRLSLVSLDGEVASVNDIEAFLMGIEREGGSLFVLQYTTKPSSIIAKGIVEDIDRVLLEQNVWQAQHVDRRESYRAESRFAMINLEFRAASVNTLIDYLEADPDFQAIANQIPEAYRYGWMQQEPSAPFSDLHHVSIDLFNFYDNHSAQGVPYEIHALEPIIRLRDYFENFHADDIQLKLVDSNDGLLRRAIDRGREAFNALYRISLYTLFTKSDFVLGKTIEAEDISLAGHRRVIIFNFIRSLAFVVVVSGLFIAGYGFVSSILDILILANLSSFIPVLVSQLINSFILMGFIYGWVALIATSFVIAAILHLVFKESISDWNLNYISLTRISVGELNGIEHILRRNSLRYATAMITTLLVLSFYGASLYPVLLSAGTFYAVGFVFTVSILGVVFSRLRFSLIKIDSELGSIDEHISLNASLVRIMDQFINHQTAQEIRMVIDGSRLAEDPSLKKMRLKDRLDSYLYFNLQVIGIRVALFLAGIQGRGKAIRYSMNDRKSIVHYETYKPVFVPRSQYEVLDYFVNRITKMINVYGHWMSAQHLSKVINLVNQWDNKNRKDNEVQSAMPLTKKMVEAAIRSEMPFISEDWILSYLKEYEETSWAWREPSWRKRPSGELLDYSKADHDVQELSADILIEAWRNNYSRLIIENPKSYTSDFVGIIVNKITTEEFDLQDAALADYRTMAANLRQLAEENEDIVAHHELQPRVLHMSSKTKSEAQADAIKYRDYVEKLLGAYKLKSQKIRQAQEELASSDEDLATKKKDKKRLTALILAIVLIFTLLNFIFYTLFGDFLGNNRQTDDNNLKSPLPEKVEKDGRVKVSADDSDGDDTTLQLVDWKWYGFLTNEHAYYAAFGPEAQIGDLATRASQVSNQIDEEGEYKPAGGLEWTPPYAYGGHHLGGTAWLPAIHPREANEEGFVRRELPVFPNSRIVSQTERYPDGEIKYIIYSNGMIDIKVGEFTRRSGQRIDYDLILTDKLGDYYFHKLDRTLREDAEIASLPHQFMQYYGQAALSREDHRSMELLDLAYIREYMHILREFFVYDKDAPYDTNSFVTHGAFFQHQLENNGGKIHTDCDVATVPIFSMELIRGKRPVLLSGELINDVNNIRTIRDRKTGISEDDLHMGMGLMIGYDWYRFEPTIYMGKKDVDPDDLPSIDFLFDEFVRLNNLEHLFERGITVQQKTLPDVSIGARPQSGDPDDATDLKYEKDAVRAALEGWMRADTIDWNEYAKDSEVRAHSPWSIRKVMRDLRFRLRDMENNIELHELQGDEWLYEKYVSLSKLMSSLSSMYWKSYEEYYDEIEDKNDWHDTDNPDSIRGELIGTLEAIDRVRDMLKPSSKKTSGARAANKRKGTQRQYSLLRRLDPDASLNKTDNFRDRDIVQAFTETFFAAVPNQQQKFEDALIKFLPTILNEALRGQNKLLYSSIIHIHIPSSYQIVYGVSPELAEERVKQRILELDDGRIFFKNEVALEEFEERFRPVFERKRGELQAFINQLGVTDVVVPTFVPDYRKTLQPSDNPFIEGPFLHKGNLEDGVIFFNLDRLASYNPEDLWFEAYEKHWYEKYFLPEYTRTQFEERMASDGVTNLSDLNDTNPNDQDSLSGTYTSFTQEAGIASLAMDAFREFSDLKGQRVLEYSAGTAAFAHQASLRGADETIAIASTPRSRELSKIMTTRFNTQNALATTSKSKIKHESSEHGDISAYPLGHYDLVLARSALHPLPPALRRYKIEQLLKRVAVNGSLLILESKDDLEKVEWDDATISDGGGFLAESALLNDGQYKVIRIKKNPDGARSATRRDVVNLIFGSGVSYLAGSAAERSPPKEDQNEQIGQLGAFLLQNRESQEENDIVSIATREIALASLGDASAMDEIMALIRNGNRVTTEVPPSRQNTFPDQKLLLSVANSSDVNLALTGNHAWAALIAPLHVLSLLDRELSESRKQDILNEIAIEVENLLAFQAPNGGFYLSGHNMTKSSGVTPIPDRDISNAQSASIYNGIQLFLNTARRMKFNDQTNLIPRARSALTKADVYIAKHAVAGKGTSDTQNFHAGGKYVSWERFQEAKRNNETIPFISYGENGVVKSEQEIKEGDEIFELTPANAIDASFDWIDVFGIEKFDRIFKKSIRPNAAYQVYLAQRSRLGHSIDPDVIGDNESLKFSSTILGFGVVDGHFNTHAVSTMNALQVMQQMMGHYKEDSGITALLQRDYNSIETTLDRLELSLDNSTLMAILQTTSEQTTWWGAEMGPTQDVQATARRTLMLTQPNFRYAALSLSSASVDGSRLSQPFADSHPIFEGQSDSFKTGVNFLIVNDYFSQEELATNITSIKTALDLSSVVWEGYQQLFERIAGNQEAFQQGYHNLIEDDEFGLKIKLFTIKEPFVSPSRYLSGPVMLNLIMYAGEYPEIVKTLSRLLSRGPFIGALLANPHSFIKGLRAIQGEADHFMLGIDKLSSFEEAYLRDLPDAFKRSPDSIIQLAVYIGQHEKAFDHAKETVYKWDLVDDMFKNRSKFRDLIRRIELELSEESAYETIVSTLPQEELEKARNLYPENLETALTLLRQALDGATYIPENILDTSQLLLQHPGGMEVVLDLTEVAGFNASFGFRESLGLNSRQVIDAYSIDGLKSMAYSRPHINDLRDYNWPRDNQIGVLFVDDDGVKVSSGRHTIVAPYNPFKTYPYLRLDSIEQKRLREVMGLQDGRQVIVASLAGAQTVSKFEIETILTAYKKLYGHLEKGKRPLLILGMRRGDHRHIRDELIEQGYAAAERNQEDRVGRDFDGLAEGKPMGEYDVISFYEQGPLFSLFGLADVSILGHDRNTFEPMSQLNSQVLIFGEDPLNNLITQNLAIEAGAATLVDENIFASQLEQAMNDPRATLPQQEKVLEHYKAEYVAPAAFYMKIILASIIIEKATRLHASRLSTTTKKTGSVEDTEKNSGLIDSNEKFDFYSLRTMSRFLIENKKYAEWIKLHINMIKFHIKLYMVFESKPFLGMSGIVIWYVLENLFIITKDQILYDSSIISDYLLVKDKVSGEWIGSVYYGRSINNDSSVVYEIGMLAVDKEHRNNGVFHDILNTFLGKIYHPDLQKLSHPTEVVLEFHTRTSKRALSFSLIAKDVINSVGLTLGFEAVFIDEPKITKVKEVTKVKDEAYAVQIKFYHLNSSTAFDQGLGARAAKEDSKKLLKRRSFLARSLYSAGTAALARLGMAEDPANQRPFAENKKLDARINELIQSFAEDAYYIAANELIKIDKPAMRALIDVLERPNASIQAKKLQSEEDVADIRIKIGAAITLGRMGHQEAVQPLIQLLLKLPDVSEFSAYRQLAAIFGNENRILWDLRDRIKSALVYIGDDSVEPLIKIAQQKSMTIPLQATIMDILAHIGDKRAIDPIITFLQQFSQLPQAKNAQDISGYEVIKSTLHFDHPELDQRMLAMLKDKTLAVQVRRGIITVLSRKKNEDIIPYLLNDLLGVRNDFIHKDRLWKDTSNALINMGSSSPVERLVEYLSTAMNSDNFNHPGRSLNTTYVVRVLGELAQEHDEKVEEVLLILLDRVKELTGTPIIYWSLSQEGNVDPEIEIIRALTKINGPKTSKKLSDMLQNVDFQREEEKAKEIIKAIGRRIGVGHQESDVALEQANLQYLSENLETNPNLKPYIELVLFRAGQIKFDQIREIFSNEYGKYRNESQEYALEMIGNINEKRINQEKVFHYIISRIWKRDSSKQREEKRDAQFRAVLNQFNNTSIDYVLQLVFDKRTEGRNEGLIHLLNTIDDKRLVVAKTKTYLESLLSGPRKGDEELEKSYKLVVAAQELGINSVFRWGLGTPDVRALEIIVKNRQQVDYPKDKPLAVMVYPETDWNGAFGLDSDRQMVLDLHQKGYNVQHYEARDDQSVIDSIKDGTEDKTGIKKAKFIGVAGHGYWREISIGTDDPRLMTIDQSKKGLTLGIDDRRMLLAANLGERLEEDGHVLINGCSTGKGKGRVENLANLFREVFLFAKVIWSPDKPARIRAIHFAGKEIERVEFEGTSGYQANNFRSTLDYIANLVLESDELPVANLLAKTNALHGAHAVGGSRLTEAPSKYNIWEKTVAQMQDAADVIGLDPELAEHIFFKSWREIVVEVPFETDQGDTEYVYYMRVQNNDARGPFKGGNRIDFVDYEAFDSKEEMLEESLQTGRMLSSGMTSKNAVYSLPLGGGKGKYLLNSNRTYSATEVAKIIRISVREVEKQYPNTFDPGTDSPAPDMVPFQLRKYASEFIDVFIDELLSIRESDDPIVLDEEEVQDPLQTPYLDRLLKRAKEDPSVSLRLLAAITGKSRDKGGAEGREQATALGVVWSIIATLNNLSDEQIRNLDLSRHINELTVAIQGAGNVGFNTAKILYKMGVKVTSISDLWGTIENPDGINVDEIDQHIHGDKTRPLFNEFFDALQSNDESRIDVAREQLAFPGVEHHPDPEYIHSIRADVFVTASKEDQITEDNVEDLIRTKKIYIEAGNSPTTWEADSILKTSSIIHQPDIAVNGGGVIGSYGEMQQNINREVWELSDYNYRIIRRVEATVDDVFAASRRYGTDLRTAALILAMTRVVDAELDRDPDLKSKYPQPYKEYGELKVPETSSELVQMILGEQYADLMRLENDSLKERINIHAKEILRRVNESFKEGKLGPRTIFLTGPDNTGKIFVAQHLSWMMQESWSLPVGDDGLYVRLIQDEEGGDVFREVRDEGPDFEGITIVIGKNTDVVDLKRSDDFDFYEIQFVTSTNFVSSQDHADPTIQTPKELVAPGQIRLMRSMASYVTSGDATESGLYQILSEWPSARGIEIDKIYPDRLSSDGYINTNLIYEIPLLKSVLWESLIRLQASLKAESDDPAVKGALRILDQLIQMLEGIPDMRAEFYLRHSVKRHYHMLPEQFISIKSEQLIDDSGSQAQGAGYFPAIITETPNPFNKSEDRSSGSRMSKQLSSRIDQLGDVFELIIDLWRDYQEEVWIIDEQGMSKETPNTWLETHDLRNDLMRFSELIFDDEWRGRVSLDVVLAEALNWVEELPERKGATYRDYLIFSKEKNIQRLVEVFSFMSDEERPQADILNRFQVKTEDDLPVIKRVEQALYFMAKRFSEDEAGWKKFRELASKLESGWNEIAEELEEYLLDPIFDEVIKKPSVQAAEGDISDHASRFSVAPPQERVISILKALGLSHDEAMELKEEFWVPINNIVERTSISQDTARLVRSEGRPLELIDEEVIGMVKHLFATNHPIAKKQGKTPVLTSEEILSLIELGANEQQIARILLAIKGALGDFRILVEANELDGMIEEIPKIREKEITKDMIILAKEQRINQLRENTGVLFGYNVWTPSQSINKDQLIFQIFLLALHSLGESFPQLLQRKASLAEFIKPWEASYNGDLSYLPQMKQLTFILVSAISKVLSAARLAEETAGISA